MINADHKFEADVFCKDGIIKSVCRPIPIPHLFPSLILTHRNSFSFHRKVGKGLKDIPPDASGKYVMPGQTATGLAKLLEYSTVNPSPLQGVSTLTPTSSCPSWGQ